MKHSVSVVVIFLRIFLFKHENLNLIVCYLLKPITEIKESITHQNKTEKHVIKSFACH